MQDMTLVHLHDEDKSMLPKGRGWLLVEFGGETKEEADAKARALRSRLEKRAPLGRTLYDDKEDEDHVWEVREAGLGATRSSPARRTRGRAGRIRPCPRSGSASTSATSQAGRGATATVRPLRPLRPGLHPHRGTSTSRRPGIEKFRASSTRRPTSSCRRAARCPASTATASRARSCSRRCSATSSSRRSESSRRSGTPTGR